MVSRPTVSPPSPYTPPSPHPYAPHAQPIYTGYITVLKSRMTTNPEKMRNFNSDRTCIVRNERITVRTIRNILFHLSTSLRWLMSHCFSVSEIGRQTNHKHVLNNEREKLESCRCTPTVALLRDLPLYIMRNKNDGANGTNSSHWALKSLNSQHAHAEVRDIQRSPTCIHQSLYGWTVLTKHAHCIC